MVDFDAIISTALRALDDDQGALTDDERDTLAGLLIAATEADLASRRARHSPPLASIPAGGPGRV